MEKVVLWMLLVSAALMMPGCDNVHSDADSPIELHPSTIELGDVAASGQSLEARFAIRNKSGKQIKLQLKMACSCVLVGSQEITCEPYEKKEIPFMLSTLGRSGDFATEISVVAERKTYRLPVKAKFLQQVFAFPSRLVFYPSNDATEQDVAQVLLEAPDSLWKELELYAEDGYRIHGEDVGEKRRFRVTYDGPPRKNHSPIVLRKRNQRSPVLSIPAISGVQ